MAEKRDWQAFEGKLQAGKLIEQAAEEAGIPVEEAVEWLAAQRGNKKDDEALRVLSAEALHHGITTLIELARDRTGRTSSISAHLGGSESTIYDDVDAAKELVRTGLKLRQLIKTPEKQNGQPDLFDRAPASSNWTFPDKK